MYSFDVAELCCLWSLQFWFSTFTEQGHLVELVYPLAGKLDTGSAEYYVLPGDLLIAE